MARQTYYLDRAQRHPLYPTRMLQAGPLALDAGAARLFRQLGVQMSTEKPKRAAKAPGVPLPKAGDLPSEEKAPAKRAPRRRRVKAKA